ncbi:uncharacterized protein LOC144887732 [Branchiostoma floridae x Branchiostoma japonicum]
MAGRFGLQRSTWSNPMYGRSSWDYNMGEEYEDVELSWTVNRAKREKQQKRIKKRKAQSFNMKATMLSIIILQIVILAGIAVILWKAWDPTIATNVPDSPTNWCEEILCDNGVCVEAADGFYCVCRGGWEGEFCEIDVDECKTVECHHLATCVNTAGSYACECQEGYEGDAIEACTDIDECAQADICESHLICTNTVGNYSCGCQQGFFNNGASCEQDTDECEQPDICGPHASSCINTMGSYTCDCQQGFLFNGTSCDDINECEEDDICGPWSICANTIGDYNCSCIEGFFFNGTNCEDIDECLTSPCHDFANCTNLPGNYSCACKAFYRGDGYVSCKGK